MVDSRSKSFFSLVSFRKDVWRRIVLSRILRSVRTLRLRSSLKRDLSRLASPPLPSPSFRRLGLLSLLKDAGGAAAAPLGRLMILPHKRKKENARLVFHRKEFFFRGLPFPCFFCGLTGRRIFCFLAPPVGLSLPSHDVQVYVHRNLLTTASLSPCYDDVRRRERSQRYRHLERENVGLPIFRPCLSCLLFSRSSLHIIAPPPFLSSCVSTT